MLPTLRLGTVPYLNAMPLVEGLARQPGVELVEDVPSALLPRLRGGELDAALVSAVELFRDPALAWVPGGAITSRGPVASILLFVRGPPAAIRRLALDSSSLSAATLTRVCLDGFLGVPDATLEITRCDPGVPLGEIDADAVLRIGDPALRTDPAGHTVLDLGALWTEATGLPFVYAAWLARPDAPGERLAALLDAARERGLARRPELAARFAADHGMDPDACLSYLRESIGYRLGADEQAGLAAFGTRAAALGLVDHASLPAPLRGSAERA